MASPTQLRYALRQQQFKGRTNPYAPSRSYVHGLNNQLSDLGFHEVLNADYYDQDWREATVERLNRYRQNIRFYEGEHWDTPYIDNEKKPVFNFCRVLVDRASDFFIGSSGFTLESEAGNEVLAQSLEAVWDYNDKNLLLSRLDKIGRVCGDSYIYVTVNVVDDNGQALPKDKWTVKMYAIPAVYCYPKWKSGSVLEMESVLIQIPKGQTTEAGKREMFSIFITPQTFTVFDGENKTGEHPNPFGRVNVVAFPNELRPSEPFGVSDLDHITPLNAEYNTISLSIRQIIRYHAEPTTLIYGARASDLEKGANKVWSGLPIDSRVENLELQGDLGGVYNYLSSLENMLFQMANMPKQAFAIDQGISNTSGLALQTLYQPLIDKVRRKHLIFNSVAKEVNKLILIAHDTLIGSPLAGAWDDSDLASINPRHSSVLPKDYMTELDLAQKRVSLGVSSKIAELRRISSSKDFRRVLSEILADRLGEVAYEQAKATALQGGTADPSFAFMDSIGAAEDFTKLAEELKQAYENSRNASGELLEY